LKESKICQTFHASSPNNCSSHSEYSPKNGCSPTNAHLYPPPNTNLSPKPLTYPCKYRSSTAPRPGLWSEIFSSPPATARECPDSRKLDSGTTTFTTTLPNSRTRHSSDSNSYPTAKSRARNASCKSKTANAESSKCPRPKCRKYGRNPLLSPYDPTCGPESQTPRSPTFSLCPLTTPLS
jgi:hypothetical protein